MSLADDVVLGAFRRGFALDPRLTVSEWADRFRVLTSETSPEHGQWRTSRVPYLREPMNRLSPSDPVRRVVLMFGAQLGKTEAILNAAGMRIHLVPGPMMMVLPSRDPATKDFSKERLSPLCTATPVIAERVMENRSRDGDNTIFMKRFLGGFLKATGANSAANLRSTPIRDLFCDEIDAYPLDVDGEGDPVGLAEARTSNFSRGKTCLTSTPSVKGVSRIEREFLKSDQRRYFVPCPHCNAMDTLRWDRIRYTNNDPNTAELLCGTCGCLIEERWKTQMLARGEWRPTAEGDGHTTGYHLNSLYSPLGWLSWRDIVREWLDSTHDMMLRKKFINTRLAETWEEKGEAIGIASLLERRETYEAEVPMGVGALVGSVDVQEDRLEWKVIGYGIEEESWVIAASVELGNTMYDDVWLRLDEVLRRTWTHASGEQLALECVAVDSRFRGEQAYKFCKTRQDRRVFAVRGGRDQSQPLLGKASIANAYRARVYTVCTDTAKEMIYSRIRIPVRGPGYMHLPDWVDQEYCEQLTAEKAVRHFPRNRPSWREWVPQRARNEQLDLEVYCLAALRIRYGAFPSRALATACAKLLAIAASRTGGSGAPPAPTTPAATTPKNWVTGGGDWTV